MIFGREPVAIAAVIAIAINLFVSFGLNLSVEQSALINALAIGILNLIARSSVTPVANPKLDLGTTVKTPDGGVATVSADVLR